MTLTMYDKVELDDKAGVSYTADGYLKAMPRICRTGIQIYSGEECGIVDKQVVRVYRDPDEVFKTDTVRGYTHLPLTDDHPPEMVTPKNWRQYAVGDTGDEVLRDGDTARVPMMLRDAGVIALYRAGTKRELSVGYACDLDFTPGKTADGQEYDARQINIRPNHLAIVVAARGGPRLNIGDNIGDDHMNTTLQKILVDGIQCEMTDTAAAIVNKTITGLQATIDRLKADAKKRDDDDEDEKKKCDAQIATLDAKVKTQDAQIATLTKQLSDSKLTPAQLDALVKDRTDVFAKAQKVMGDRFDITGKSVEDIRRAVVDKSLGDTAKGWNDEQVKISFDTLTANIKIDNRTGTVDHAIRVFSGKPGPGYGYHGDSNGDPQAQAYDAYCNDLSNAWMRPEDRPKQ